MIMDKVLIEGQDAKLTPEQIKAAQGQMLGVLKTLSGQRVSEKRLWNRLTKPSKQFPMRQKYPPARRQPENNLWHEGLREEDETSGTQGFIGCGRFGRSDGSGIVFREIVADCRKKRAKG